MLNGVRANAFTPPSYNRSARRQRTANASRCRVLRRTRPNSLCCGLRLFGSRCLAIYSKLETTAHAAATLEGLGFLWLRQPNVTFTDIPECSVRHVFSGY
jgi:hypothetical protein